MEKIVLLGIDGATPDLMEKWIDQEKLPNFQKIKKNGAWGKLKSTTPPFSAPAWTSIVTGCNPGKHGIYGFETTGTLESHLISSSYRKVPAIWNYLTDIGLKSIIINVLGTYPPEKINGTMITGLLTPSYDSNFTYPEKIKKRLNVNDLGEYDLEQVWLDDFSRSRMKKQNPNKFVNNINKQMTSRFLVGLNLMKETDFDFTMIVFRGTDTAQHYLFNDKNLLLLCYQKVDELVGKIIDNFPNATFLIVSDHGFGEIKKILFPDNALYNAKYLTPSQDPYGNVISQFHNFINRAIFYAIKFFPQEFFRESKAIKKIIFSGISKTKLINFSKTLAFTTAEGRCIQICKKDKYKEGIVEKKDYNKLCDEISKFLLNLKDPEDDSQIIEKVYRWNEIYGQNALNPPDITIDLKEGISTSEWMRFPNKINEIIQSNKNNIPYIFNQDLAGRSGDHTPYGIICAYGKNIKKGHIIKKASVEDILPTIFNAIGISLPHIIDGEILVDIFIKKPKVKTINWKSYTTSKHPLSKAEMMRINKLKNLHTTK